MNDATQNHLKILVEKVVRSVRASSSRKRKMREELLAHVNAVFEEEAKLGDEAVALARTSQRFGLPAELTRQLQSAVPAGDAPVRIIESFVGDPTQESPWRRALRYAGLVGSTCLAALPILMWLRGGWDEWLTIARLPSLLTPLFMAMLVFCATLIEHGMRRALFGGRGRNWLGVIASGAAAWLLVPTFTLGWTVAFGGGFVRSLVDLWPLFLSGLLAPMALMLILGAAIDAIRYQQEWASLKID
jgi:hypothetical protein